MKILVFSDAHGNFSNARDAIIDHPEANAVIFLGDGAREFENLKNQFDMDFYILKGNCDFADTHDLCLFEIFGGKKIYACHGHTHFVKNGLSDLKDAARSMGADIVLYGHTHVAKNIYDDGLYIMNPGSCSGYKASYGIIEITNAGILTNIVNF